MAIDTLSKILFYRDLGVDYVKGVGGGEPVFSRAGIAHEWNGHMYAYLGTNAPRRPQVIDPVSGKFVRALGLSRSSENLVLDSSDISTANWTLVSASITGTAPGIIENEDGTLVNAQILTAGSSGGARAEQVVGTSSSGPEVFWVVLRDIDVADVSQIDVVGATDGSYIIATYNWITETFALGAGDRGGAIDLGNGYVLLWAAVDSVTTSGQSRTLRVWADRATGATGSVEVIHAQLELQPAPTGLIVTGAASATRAVETLTYPGAPEPQPMAFYARFIFGGAVAADRVLKIGKTDGSSPKFLSFTRSDKSGVFFADGVGNDTREVAYAGGPPVPGDLVEVVGVLDASFLPGAAGRVNEGTVADAGVGTGTSEPSAWSENTIQVNTGDGTNGNHQYLATKIVKLSALENAGRDAAMFNELRDLKLDFDRNIIDSGS